jgi:RNA polymerase sigma-70 factor, ECF subfamily
MSEQAIGTDDELLRRMASGCEESFVALYRRESPRVYRFALRMCGSEETADEVTQEVFLFLLRRPSSFDPRKGQLAAWLLGVARNCALRVIERDSRYIAVEDAQLESASSRNALDDLENSESVESLRAAVLALPPHYREAVVLCEMEEMSYEQAAAVLGCAVGTVRSRLHRARAILHEKLTVKAGCEL